MTNETVWGYHLVLDCARCNKDCIKSEDNIRAFLSDLLVKTDMKPWGDPIIANLQDCEDHIKGYSAVQLIHTSSITCHFSDMTGDSYIDVFSCKDFDVDSVIKCIENFFAPENIIQTLIHRDANK